VHRILCHGLLESVYEEALRVELTVRQIAFARQVPLSVDHKHQQIFNIPELRRGIKRCINSSCGLGALGGLAVRTTGPDLPKSVPLETSR